MNSLLRLSLVLIALATFSIAYAHKAQAQGCVVTGATPDGGEVVNCSGTDTNGISTTNQADDVTIEKGSDISSQVNGGNVIDTLDGDDKVTMEGGTVSNDTIQNVCIELGPGNTEFEMHGGKLLCEHGVRNTNPGSAKMTFTGGEIVAVDEAIQGRNGGNEIYISGGKFFAGDGVVQTGSGEDKIVITGGLLRQTDNFDEVIESFQGNDMISVSHAIIDGTIADNRQAIDGNADDDMVRLGTGAVILGLITGGQGFDTLVFEMGLPRLESQAFAHKY